MHAYVLAGCQVMLRDQRLPLRPLVVVNGSLELLARERHAQQSDARLRRPRAQRAQRRHGAQHVAQWQSAKYGNALRQGMVERDSVHDVVPSCYGPTSPCVTCGAQCATAITAAASAMLL